jgi:hypothetical protein
MRVLFFTNSHEDYLADSVFHGFRTLFGSDCIDYPKCEQMYKNCPAYIKAQVRGNGFSLYSGLLDDIEVDRFNIPEKIKRGFFDLIVFSNIQRQYGFFVQFLPWLNRSNTVILDGDDTTQPYPSRGLWWKAPYWGKLPKAHRNFLYFKREWVPDTHFGLFRHILPFAIRKLLPQPANLRRISFSFPAEKIVTALPEKTKKFPVHIVDEEVAGRVENAKTRYAFAAESEYYEDLQQSQFGITTKRGGWDCLRHYEIAANGAVICFKNLSKKPDTCAPHGLSAENAIVYQNVDELLELVDKLSEEEYRHLQQGALNWVRQYTTEMVAKQIIKELSAR